MHALLIERADGSRFKVTLRRYIPEYRKSTSEDCRREFRVLQLLDEAGIAAPRPLLLDADGAYFGAPAMALSYLPGRAWSRQTNLGSWTRQLAHALLPLHAVTPDRYDLTFLPPNGMEQMRESLEKRRERVATEEPLTREVLTALDTSPDGLTLLPPCLVHDDYFPGNTVWYRGRLTGIIDWAQATVGDPRMDVGQCRLDLVVSHGMEVADVFLADYEAAMGARLPRMWFFDLFYGLSALLYYEIWLQDYHDAGLTDVLAEDVKPRLDAFLRRALAQRAASL